MSEASIRPYSEGPLIVRGPVALVDHEGREIDKRRRTVALCRCGASAIKPFCDGTHKQLGEHADPGRDGGPAAAAR